MLCHVVGQRTAKWIVFKKIKFPFRMDRSKSKYFTELLAIKVFYRNEEQSKSQKFGKFKVLRSKFILYKI